jgi:methylthioribose-1-phosphate isomerase
MMELPLLTQNRDTVRYDREHGAVLALDRWRYPHETILVEYTDFDSLARALPQMLMHTGGPQPYIAGYALALAARQHRRWPTESQRATLVQAAEQLRQVCPMDYDMHTLLQMALQTADLALLRGEPAEPAIVALVDAEISRSDTVAEACGRHAASLLEDGACLLVHGFGGGAFNWMLHHAHVQQGKQLDVYATETRPSLQGTRLTTQQADQLGVRVTLITDNMPGLYFRRGTFTCYVAAAYRIACDGSTAGHIGTYQYAVMAARHGVPCYVLGYAGPDPLAAEGTNLIVWQGDPEAVLHFAGERTAAAGVTALYPTLDITPPDLITQIATERGTLEPEQLAAYQET